MEGGGDPDRIAWRDYIRDAPFCIGSRGVSHGCHYDHVGSAVTFEDAAEIELGGRALSEGEIEGADVYPVRHPA